MRICTCEREIDFENKLITIRWLTSINILLTAYNKSEGSVCNFISFSSHFLYNKNWNIRIRTNTRTAVLNINSYTICSKINIQMELLNHPVVSAPFTLMSTLPYAYLKFCSRFSCFPIQQHQKKKNPFVCLCVCDSNNLNDWMVKHHWTAVQIACTVFIMPYYFTELLPSLPLPLMPLPSLPPLCHRRRFVIWKKYAWNTNKSYHTNNAENELSRLNSWHTFKANVQSIELLRRLFLHGDTLFVVNHYAWNT